MSSALRWNGSSDADCFIFNHDYDRFDLVFGGRGSDVISDGVDDGYWSSDGQRGNDTLISTDGYDVLRAGKGDDTLKVVANWYDPADLQFPQAPDAGHANVGFDVKVFGGAGHDRLLIADPGTYSIEEVGEDTIIHTSFGGTITARYIEEFLFV